MSSWVGWLYTYRVMGQNMWFVILNKYVYSFLIFFQLDPDNEEVPNTHRRFISPRPSASGAKLYLHDNSLKCRTNQQQQRVLSSFSSAMAMSSSVSSNNNSSNGNNNCSSIDGTHQIQQTPSILAAATLPRNFSNQGRYLVIFIRAR